MIIKAYYSGGRIDVFDTDRMTDGIPQSGNLLTNYSLDLADVNGETVLIQIAGELVDAAALSWISEDGDVLAPLIERLPQLLLAAGIEDSEEVVPSAVSQRIRVRGKESTRAASRFDEPRSSLA